MWKSFSTWQEELGITKAQGLYGGWEQCGHTSGDMWNVPIVLSVQLSRSVMSDSLWPQGLKHARLPVLHKLPELAHTHVHQVGDAIQPSHPLSSPSPPTFNLSQHQGLSNESVLCMRWPKYWTLYLYINPLLWELDHQYKIFPINGLLLVSFDTMLLLSHFSRVQLCATP